MKRLFPLLLSSLTAALLLFIPSGCSTSSGGQPMMGSYKLGSMLPSDIRSVYIPAMKNLTREPLVEIEATRALQRELQTDGSLVIVEEEDADAILEINLNRFLLRPLVYGRENRARPDEYSAMLSGSIRLIRRDNGAVIVNEPYVAGDFFVPFVTDITSAKRNVLPDVSRDLAHDIVERIVEAWPDSSDPAGWGSPGRSGNQIPDAYEAGGSDRGGYNDLGFDTDDGPAELYRDSF